MHESQSTQVRIIMIKMAGGYWEASYRVGKLAVDQRRLFSFNEFSLVYPYQTRFSCVVAHSYNQKWSSYHLSIAVEII